MDPKIKDAMRRQVEKEPFAKKLGLKLIDVDEGYALVEMKSTKEMENIFQMIHGGAIFTLIDEAFEISCNSHGTVAVALNVNITYHKAPSPESTLKDEKENLIASCQALAYRKGDKLPFLED
jgi:acyl-CoA thioesterase